MLQKFHSTFAVSLVIVNDKVSFLIVEASSDKSRHIYFWNYVSHNFFCWSREEGIVIQRLLDAQ